MLYITYRECLQLLIFFDYGELILRGWLVHSLVRWYNGTVLIAEIVDGNLKMTLGMIWTIILRFAIQDISVEGVCVFVYLSLEV